MMHVDVPRVRGKMAEHGFTITSMANTLNIARNTLISYLKTPEKMPYGVVVNMANLLCNSHAEAEDIFFAPNLRKTKDSD